MTLREWADQMVQIAERMESDLQCLHLELAGLRDAMRHSLALAPAIEGEAD